MKVLRLSALRTGRIRPPRNTYGTHEIYLVLITVVERGGTVVKVLRYKSEGLWFDSRWCH